MTGVTEIETIWDRTRLGITIGSVVLIFLAAIEALAVTTVMPVVSADLHGEALYAVAFSGTLATSVIGMVAAGTWSDRAGPRAPLYTAVALFLLGLVVSGLALDMYTFLAGRLVQGLGAGGQTVALYVVVARVYPPHLHGRIFAAYAAAWVVPSMIGPFLAGLVTELMHWRWTFLGVAVLTAAAFVLVVQRLSGVSLDSDAGDADSAPDADAPDATTASQGERGGFALRLLLAVVVAVCAVGVGFTVELPFSTGGPLAAIGIVAIGVALLPLLPRRTLRAAAGLPSVVLTRGLIAGAFFAAEAYIPKLLMDDHGFSPSIAGLALTLAALGWSSASAVQGRWGDRLGSRRIMLIAFALIMVALLAILGVVVLWPLPWIVMIGWGLAGAGMGLLYPRLTVLTLAYSTTRDEGFNSSALSIADATGSALAVAVAGLGFVAVPLLGSGFATVYLFAAVLTTIAMLPGLRMGDAQR
ncbi:MFS transporter [Microbacterium esteraromaticum]|uniref:MFS transporter n=1 Tax=Microbacterium esteraromaticum TaxID=57043 RepID=A0A7D7WBH6_9MICO|nr:MFS transporter [Microbacterium esteraromaticum]QMU98316.1 MFS transporter [Microbacterium esteraromaticum]